MSWPPVSLPLIVLTPPAHDEDQAGKSVPLAGATPVSNVPRQTEPAATTRGRRHILNLCKSLPRQFIPKSHSKFGTDELAALAHMKIHDLQRHGGKDVREQQCLLKEVKKLIGEIVQRTDPDPRRADRLGTLACSLSAKLGDRALHRCDSQMLRILERLMAPGLVDNTRFATFSNIRDSRSALLSTDARSKIIDTILASGNVFADVGNSRIVRLVIDQIDHGVLNAETWEHAVRFLAFTALGRVYRDWADNPNAKTVVHPIEVLRCINDTLERPRTEGQLRELRTALRHGLGEMMENHRVFVHNPSEARMGRQQVDLLLTLSGARQLIRKMRHSIEETLIAMPEQETHSLSSVSSADSAIDDTITFLAAPAPRARSG